MYSLLNQNDSHIYIKLDYKPILNHYLRNNNLHKVEQYTVMMLQDQEALKEKRLNFNLVEAITDLQTEQQRKELEIISLKKKQSASLVPYICYFIRCHYFRSCDISFLSKETA